MKKRTLFRAAALLWIVLSLLVAEGTTWQERAEDYDLKLAASRKTAQCFAQIRQYKKAHGFDYDPIMDPNDTGLLGPDYSFITTTLGNEEAKRTSINPDFAAVIVDMFSELHLKQGDTIAVNCSGSFPALNIAVKCAAETYGLKEIGILSFGSSTHGANDPDLTYPDMEHLLWEKGLIQNRSTWFSDGGMNDQGGEMPAEIRTAIEERLKGYGYLFLKAPDLRSAILDRYRLYNESEEIKCFVNVGGNDVSFGDSMIIVYSDGGILTSLPDRDDTTGLVQLFLRDHVPVIHLLNIKSLAGKYGLPVDPSFIPEPGSAPVYWQKSYHKWICFCGIVIGAWLLYLSKEEMRK